MNSIKELMQAIKNRPADAPAVRYVDKEGVNCRTNSELIRDVYSAAECFNSYFGGEAKGKHVAFVSLTSYELVVSVLACGILGAVSVLINPLEGEERVKILAGRADADLVVKDPSEFVPIKEKAEAEAIERVFSDYADDFSFLLFTSGTTGDMKGVMLSQRNFLSSATRITNVFEGINRIRPDIAFASCYVMLPMYHAFGLAITFTALSGGVTLDLCLDFRMFYSDLKMLNSEIVACPPIAIKMFAADILNKEVTKWGKGIKFIFSGAARISPVDLTTIAQNNILVAYGYGMTETAGSGTLNVFMTKFESAGRAADSTKIEIRDGEIFLKDDSVMLGYYKDPVNTSETLVNGFVATGDLGYIDEEGFLYITGRKKNLIILSGGENVSPEEIENRLMEYPEIREVLVKEKDQNVFALIFCRPGDEETIKEKIKEYNKTVPSYKRVTKYEFVHEPLEKTGIGKIKRS